MSDELAQRAVAQALKGQWEEAILTNLKILKDSPNDIDALNRLSRAYAESGDIQKAKKTTQKVIKIDPINTIANKSLEKWKHVKKIDADKGVPTDTKSESFLEDPGKTRIVPLIHLGDSDLLAGLTPGEKVDLVCHPHRVSVVTTEGKYIGRLPDDLSARLRKLIKMGNAYQVFVKTLAERDVKVFIREQHKSSAAADITSFPTEKMDYISFTPPELVHKDEPIDLGDTSASDNS